MCQIMRLKWMRSRPSCTGAPHGGNSLHVACTGIRSHGLKRATRDLWTRKQDKDGSLRMAGTVTFGAKVEKSGCDRGLSHSRHDQDDVCSNTNARVST